jgi:hypothetical protein
MEIETPKHRQAIKKYGIQIKKNGSNRSKYNNVPNNAGRISDILAFNL